MLDQVLFDFDTYFTQGGCAKDGKIYFCFGLNDSNKNGHLYPQRIRVFDTDTKTICASYELRGLIEEEPEDLSIVGNRLYINTNSKKIYSITLPSFLAREDENPHSMKFQGYERNYFLTVPDTLNDKKPLVIMLHGHGSRASLYRRLFSDAARKYGYVLCCPQGLVEPEPKWLTAWNVGYPFQEGWKVDDCAFLLALADKIVKENKLNPSNVFLSGMSNGGEMCYLMAHRHPEKFAGIASMAGLQMEWIYRDTKPSAPVAFLEIHGTADKTSKWVGDPSNKDGWGKYTSVPTAIGRIVSTNCCTHEICDTLPVIRNKVVRHQYLGGTDGKNVTLYEIIGGKHAKGEQDLDLHGILWEFIEKNMK